MAEKRFLGLIALLLIPIAFFVIFVKASPVISESATGRVGFIVFWGAIALGYLVAAGWWWLKPTSTSAVVKVGVIVLQAAALVWLLLVFRYCC